jgi:hypothetical protein
MTKNVPTKLAPAKVRGQASARVAKSGGALSAKRWTYRPGGADVEYLELARKASATGWEQ